MRLGGTAIAPLGRWRDRASCLDADPTLFDATERTVLRRHRDTARDYCRRCPVIQDCARYADEAGEPGLWAGSYRRQARTGTVLIPEAPTPGSYTRPTPAVA
jgi:WhiB family redox-sensing transcriptional regulator